MRQAKQEQTAEPGKDLAQGTTNPLPNALTVDIEDWYHSILEIEPEQWPKYEDRVMVATEKLLTCLADQGVRGTFFVLGHVAEMHPDLVPQVDAAGHEIACHGYAHRLVYTLTPDEFRADCYVPH